jgi:serine protease Do
MKNQLIFFITFFYFTVFSIQCFGQLSDRKEIEQILSKGINKAYPACVRIMGFDTVRKVQNSSQFSGVVVTPEGHILTVAHAVVPKRIYKVTFPDGKECLAMALARIVVVEATTQPDVAMMKILTKGHWPFAEMGWSSSIKINEPCISISYPETLAQLLPTLRFGKITKDINQWGFIESTCAMEQGDSGGPLFDDMGRVIALHSRCDTSEEVNYDVPVDLYRKYWTALKFPENYKVLPTEDNFSPDPFAMQISTISPAQNLYSTFKKDQAKLAVDVLKIKSTINGNEQNILGTLFSSKGIKTPGKGSLLVTKNSMIGQDPIVETGNNKFSKAIIISRDLDNDLALLQISVDLKIGLELALLNTETFKFSHQAKFLISPIDTSGKISILGSMQFSVPAKYSSGYFGATAIFKDGFAQLTRIQPNTPASENNFEPGDLIREINGVKITSAEIYNSEFQRYWPGDNIMIKTSRGETINTIDVVLGYRPLVVGSHPAEHFASGKSLRRDGFKKVFAHDARLTPSECGGPVFDCDGNFYGINIARFSRTTTLAIPVSQVNEFIKKSIK